MIPQIARDTTSTAFKLFNESKQKYCHNNHFSVGERQVIES